MTREAKIVGTTNDGLTVEYRSDVATYMAAVPWPAKGDVLKDHLEKYWPQEIDDRAKRVDVDREVKAVIGQVFNLADAGVGK